MKALKIIGYCLLFFFAGIGLLFTGVFIAMQFDLLNVRGSIDERNASILEGSTSTTDAEQQEESLLGKILNLAKSSQQAPVAGDQASQPLSTEPDYSCANKATSCLWDTTREWEVVAGGLTKDAALINQVAAQTDVSPRLIAAVVVPEQIRFFTSSREVFKRYFEPLKILGSLSKFSLGVSGIKQETAEKIEQYANDPTSPFYPGDEYAAMIAYEDGTNESDELFLRLTDEKNHYYSYLYTAIYIKEILAQWEQAGYDISNEPEIVATIFNLGFSHSNPKPNPQVGGAAISVGGQTYAFGDLAGQFYESEELPSLAR